VKSSTSTTTASTHASAAIASSTPVTIRDRLVSVVSPIRLPITPG
jgi:hypothetical protein